MQIVSLPPFKIRGRKWQGKYSEVGQLKEVIHRVEGEKDFLEPIKPKEQWGLSFHLIEEGFVHYSGFEVEDESKVGEYQEITIPSHTYVSVHHPKGRDVGETYQDIYQWFRDWKYEPYLEQDTKYFDGLPLKFEKYPVDRDWEDPHFDIYIPLQK